jgi:hypothetical protein
MNSTEGVDLTGIMRRDGILRIADNGGGFSVYMRGDILGTGKDVGEAYRNALRQRNARAVRVAA